MTQQRGTDRDEYETYKTCADDGKGGDITNGGAALKTFEEWLGIDPIEQYYTDRNTGCHAAKSP